MGGIVSSCSSKIRPDVVKDWQTDFKLLTLSQDDVRKFQKLFQKVNYDAIEINSFVALMAVDTDQTSLTAKLFHKHCNSVGHMNFRQFVLAVWNFCSLSFDMLARCVFDLYDVDRQGSLNLKIVLQILIDNYDIKSTSCKVVQNLIRELQSQILPNQMLNVQAFVKLSQTHYELLLPTYTAQTQMRRNVLGLHYWDQATKKRAVVSCNEYLDIHIYLGLLQKLDRSSQVLTLKPRPSRVSVVDDASRTKGGKAVDGHSFSSHRTCNTVDSHHSVDSVNISASSRSSSTALLQSPRPQMDNCRRKVPPPSKTKSKTAAATAANTADFTLDLSIAPLRNKRLVVCE